jgi:hypothetical protein
LEYSKEKTHIQKEDGIMELCCAFCKTPAYTVKDGNALCYEHSKLKLARTDSYNRLKEMEFRMMMKKYQKSIKP